MSLKKILKLMKEKYGEDTALLIFDDESGRIVYGSQATNPYEKLALLNFSSIKELIENLQEK